MAHAFANPLSFSKATNDDPMTSAQQVKVTRIDLSQQDDGQLKGMIKVHFVVSCHNIADKYVIPDIYPTNHI